MLVTKPERDGTSANPSDFVAIVGEKQRRTVRDGFGIALSRRNRQGGCLVLCVPRGAVMAKSRGTCLRSASNWTCKIVRSMLGEASPKFLTGEAAYQSWKTPVHTNRREAVQLPEAMNREGRAHAPMTSLRQFAVRKPRS